MQVQRVPLLVLAASFKQQGVCLGGRVLQQTSAGAWLSLYNCRPVSSENPDCNAIPKQYLQGVKVLDVIEIGLVKSVAVEGQPENWLWDGRPIKKLFSYANTPNVLSNILDTPDCLGEVAQYQADEWSMACIQPQDFSFQLEYKNGRERWLSSFTYRGKPYSSVTITDAVFIQAVQRLAEPVRVGEVCSLADTNCWLLLSRTLPFPPTGKRYLLAAAVIPHHGASFAD